MKILLIFFSLLLMSCHSGTEPPIDENKDPLIPLAVGNYWVYDAYYLKEDGSIDFPAWPESNVFGFKVSDTLNVTLNGKKTKTFKLSLYDHPTNSTSSEAKLIYNGKDGIYYSGITDKDTVKMLFDDLLFVYPPTKGYETLAHTFYYTSTGNYLNILDSIKTTYTCVSTDSLFSTPVGNFRCIVYKLKLMLDDVFYLGDIYYFLKPGVGLVGIIEMTYSYITNTIIS